MTDSKPSAPERVWLLSAVAPKDAPYFAYQYEPDGEPDAIEYVRVVRPAEVVQKVNDAELERICNRLLVSQDALPTRIETDYLLSALAQRAPAEVDVRAAQCPVTCDKFPLNGCKESHQCVLDAGHPFDPFYGGGIHHFVTHMLPVPPRVASAAQPPTLQARAAATVEIQSLRVLCDGLQEQLVHKEKEAEAERALKWIHFENAAKLDEEVRELRRLLTAHLDQPSITLRARQAAEEWFQVERQRVYDFYGLTAPTTLPTHTQKKEDDAVDKLTAIITTHLSASRGEGAIHHLPNWLWCERCKAWIETRHACGAQYVDNGEHVELVRPAVVELISRAEAVRIVERHQEQLVCEENCWTAIKRDLANAPVWRGRAGRVWMR